MVSRRVGGAVTRNRARRRLSAAVQRRLALLDPGVDLVLVARRGAAECPFAEVDQDVERLLREAGVLRAAAGAGGEDEV
ncbi:MAG: ribonuclease P protein component [Bacillota bacterium]|nr:MAG: ribonuclease P protein component [Bacillota bacterium]